MNQLTNVPMALTIVLTSLLVVLAIGIVLIYVLTFVEKKGRWEQFTTTARYGAGKLKSSPMANSLALFKS